MLLKTEVRSIYIELLGIYINASTADCGLTCQAGSEVYGLTDDEQNVVDLFKILGCTLWYVCFLQF